MRMSPPSLLKRMAAAYLGVTYYAALQSFLFCVEKRTVQNLHKYRYFRPKSILAENAYICAGFGTSTAPKGRGGGQKPVCSQELFLSRYKS